MKTLASIAILFFISCSGNENKFSAMLKNADRFRIIKNENPLDTSIFISKQFLISLQDVFEKAEANCDCVPKKEIIFYNGKKLLFSAAISQIDKDCAFIIISSESSRECYRLNYRAGMYLSAL